MKELNRQFDACSTLRCCDLLNEVLLSYNILFRDDAKARKLYRRYERKAAQKLTLSGVNLGKVDPQLDKACGYHLHWLWSNAETPMRESYSVRDDFPILGERLLRIQRFTSSIQSNRVLSLWNDRRNMLQ